MVFSQLLFNHKIADYLTVTDIVADKIMQDLILHYDSITDSKKKDSLAGIKLTVPTKGCGGLSYNLEFAYNQVNVEESDELIVLPNGVRIFIDPKRGFALFGMVMDYQDDGIEYGFRFINPNEAGRCGCGSSFYIKNEK